MPRRYRRTGRYTRRLKTVKYSNETRAFNFEYTFDTNQKAISIITVNSEQGMRKAKNFTLNIGANNLVLNNEVSNEHVPIAFALVYVPQGTVPSVIAFGTESQGVISTTSLYEPNQNVILSGLIMPGDNARTFYSRLARNLNSGDSIGLCVRSPFGGGPGAKCQLICSLNYAISF